MVIYANPVRTTVFLDPRGQSMTTGDIEQKRAQYKNRMHSIPSTRRVNKNRPVRQGKPVSLVTNSMLWLTYIFYSVSNVRNIPKRPPCVCRHVAAC
jgi:hypothetical protein